MRRTIRAPLRAIHCIPPGRHGPIKVDIRPIDSPSLRAALEADPTLCATITYDIPRHARKAKGKRK